MNAEELASRLRMLCQFISFQCQCARRVSLLHRDINAANPRVVHRTCATMFPLRQPLRCSWAAQFHWLSSPPRWLRASIFYFTAAWVLLLCYSAAPGRGTGRADRCTDLLCLRHRPICGLPVSPQLARLSLRLLWVREHWHVTGGNSDRCSLDAAASAFSSSGETARSLLAITHQDGLVFQAAVVTVAPKTAAAVGPVSRQQLLLLVRQILGEVFSDSFGSRSENLQHPHGLRCLAEPAETVW